MMKKKKEIVRYSPFLVIHLYLILCDNIPEADI
jgi:hypothetical protein